LNSDKTVWFAALFCDWIIFCLLIHSTALLSKVNKDPVYQTDLHFLKGKIVFEKNFDIQFTPSCISANKVSNIFKTDAQQFSSPLTCFYCMRKGHSVKNCKIRKFDVPKGLVRWVPKSTSNTVGPKFN